MTTLVTGSTGKLGKNLVKFLHEANAPALLATRSGTTESPYKAVKFDWFDASTYSAPFEADTNIDKIFLIQPIVFDPLVYIRPFAELAITKGVKRFFFVSSNHLKKGDVVNGKVHEYLADRGVDYVILRPTSFIENFGTVSLRSIRDKDEIFSACGDGKMAWVGVDDIAQIARDALLAKTTTNNDVIIVGPQLYTHDEAAELLSDILGRKITHRRLTPAELQAAFQSFGMEEKFASMLVYLHSEVAAGTEELTMKAPCVYVGKHTLTEYIKAHKALWIKA